jgi:hypothetical protein
VLRLLRYYGCYFKKRERKLSFGSTSESWALKRRPHGYRDAARSQERQRDIDHQGCSLTGLKPLLPSESACGETITYVGIINNVDH